MGAVILLLAFAVANWHATLPTRFVDVRVVARLAHPEAMGMAWSPDGRFLASTGIVLPRNVDANGRNVVGLWDVRGALVGTTEKGGPGQPLAFTPDGKRVIYSRLWDAPMKTTAFSVWDIQTGAVENFAGPFPEETPRAEAANPATLFAPSAQGNRLAIVFNYHNAGRPMWVIDRQTFQPIKTDLQIPVWGVSAIALNPDGELLALGQYSGEIQILRVADGSELRRFKAHAPSVKALAFSPDGRQVVSSSGSPYLERDDKTGQMVPFRDDDPIRVWDVETGRLAHSYKGGASWSRAIAWSPDGRYIASAGEDARVRIWDAKSSRLLSDAIRFRRLAMSVVFDKKSGRLAASGTDGIFILEIREKRK